MNKRFKRLPLIVFGIYIVFFVALFVFDKSSNELIQTRDLNELSGNFLVNGKDYDKLPSEVNSNGLIVIEKNIESLNNQDYLLVRTSLQDIRVFDGDVLIYEKKFNNQNHPYASLWHLIPIGDIEDLKIELYSPFEQMSGLINPLYHGTLSEIYGFIFDEHLATFFVGVVLLLISIVICILSFVYFKSTRTHYIYMGTFLALISLWIISESKILQFVVGSPDVIGTLSYVTLAVLGVPILFFFKQSSLNRYNKFLNVTIIFISIWSFAIVAFQLSGFASYFTTVVYTQFIIIMIALTILALLINECFRYNNKEARQAVKVLGVFFLFSIAEFINFLIGSFKYTSMFLVVGVIIVTVVILVDYLKSISIYNKNLHETRALKKLAYTDYLTGANNRLSFEQRLESILLDPQSFVVLFYFDVDHLKEINDTFGHNEGDRVIKKSYEIISSVFDEVNCFRVGGDEFACIRTNLSDQQIKLLKDSFKQALSICQLDETCNISISMGYTTSKQAKTIYEIIKVADEQMYKQKRNKQNNESITAEIY